VIDTGKVLTSALGSALGLLLAGLIFGVIGYGSMQEIAADVRAQISSSDTTQQI
jgi:hypothetical protein